MKTSPDTYHGDQSAYDDFMYMTEDRLVKPNDAIRNQSRCPSKPPTDYELVFSTPDTYPTHY
jgi:hypothetical protein